MSYGKYIVAFIDILGFKNLVKQSEYNEADFLNVHRILNRFVMLQKKETWEKARALIEVEEDAQKKELDDFYIDSMVHCTCFSDSVIIAVDAHDKVNERCSALIALLAQISTELLRENVLLRGAVAYGNLFVDNNSNTYFGTALNKAYELESTVAKYPRIILSSDLIKQLSYPLIAKCDRMPYHQYIERFSDGTVGFSPLIYLQVMQGAPDILPDEELKRAVVEVKTSILKGLDNSIETPTIYEKYAWLVECYNNLTILEIDAGHIYFPKGADSWHNIHFSTMDDIKTKAIYTKYKH